MILGHQLLGSGPTHVLVVHDWFCDSSSYDSLIPYLDKEQFTYCFADLRGYGRSRSISGSYTLDEASDDLLALVNTLGWQAFHFVGHSMSALIAQYVALQAPQKVKAIVAITPVPASGLPAPDAILQFLEYAAKENNDSAKQIVNFMTGGRYQGSHFIEYKVARWRATSTPEARIGYLKMFSQSNFAAKVKGRTTPILVAIGEQDNEAHQEPAMRKTFLEWYPKATLKLFQGSGHYPMQEEPVALACAIENFLKENK